MKKILKAAQGFNTCDFALFKIYLCAVGVLLGAYLYEFFLSHIIYVWAVAILCGCYVCTRLVMNYIKER